MTGFDRRDLAETFERVAHEHWLLMPPHGLPQDARALALRALGSFLTLRMIGAHNMSGRPLIAPFANAVGRSKVWKEGRL